MATVKEGAVCLDPLEVAHLQPVLEDTLQKLAIIGHIMQRSELTGQATTQMSGDAFVHKISSGVEAIRLGQTALDKQFERVKEANESRLTALPANRDNLISELKSMAGSLQQGLADVPSSSEAGDPWTKDNLVKLNTHRKEIETMFDALLGELRITGSFESITKRVQDIVKEREEDEFLITNEANTKEYLALLQRDQATLQLKADTELAEVNGKISIFKDKMQEKRSRLEADELYAKELASESTGAFRDRQAKELKRLDAELRQVNADIDMQSVNHERMMSLLKTLYEELSGKLVYWSGKYDEDTMDLQEKLDALKEQKERDLQALHNMLETYKEYEKVVEADRKEKAEIARQKEQKALEELSAVKVQAWWRGMLYRHQLGPYKKKKKKKGKGSGKKKGKGKGKKKKK